jgi:FixJ family two-component response regulator
VTAVTKHVVVGVDDDFRVRESIARLTESAGYASMVFSSAEAFLDSGTLAETSCLITDVRMPGLDGLELQRRIRIEYPKLPVIFITAHFHDDVRRRALDGGAIEFLYKPFDAADLLRAIAQALNGSPNDGV